MNKGSKIYVAGHNGMVGSACWRLLKKEGYQNLIGKSSNELDLRNQKEVFTFFENEKPDIVIDAAAKVGGIWANNEYPFQFLMDNMLIQNNLINSSLKNNVRKFIFLGSSCIYPKNAPQPLKEEYLLTSELEPTNQWYAIAKISGVKLIESIRKQFGYDYVALMPTNLYGPGDNYDLKTSHVLPALIRKYHEAKLNGDSVTLWGTGNPLREFLHVDDLARAILLFVKNQSVDIVMLKSPVVSDPDLELICPVSKDSPAFNALKRGEVINHICYQTRNYQEILKRFERRIVRKSMPAPVELFGGGCTFFAYLNGQLTEFVEEV